MNEIKIKPKKEINEPLIIRAIGCLLITVGVLFILSGFSVRRLFSSKFIILLLCTIPLSILCAYAAERIGSNLGGMLSFRSSKRISPREQLSADLEKARHSKRNSRFQESLEIIEEVLRKDANFPEALFLKAQVLWDGFGKSVESKQIFRRVMKLVRAGDPLYRWSSYYINEITEKDKMSVKDYGGSGKQ